MTAPTRKQLDDACFSYRHDYGILDQDAKQFCKMLGFADHYSWEAIYDQVKLMKEQA